jgi:MoxR-like ATPase
MFFIARALAGMQGRDYLLPDDVKTAALPVLRHRILLKPEADLEGLTPDQVIRQVIGAVEVPK